MQPNFIVVFDTSMEAVSQLQHAAEANYQAADERDVPKPATYPFCESPSCVATLSAHSHGVNSVAFHPKAPLLVTCSDDYTAKLWRFPPDGSAATCVATLSGHDAAVLSVAFHRTAPLLATGSYDKTAKLWR